MNMRLICVFLPFLSWASSALTEVDLEYRELAAVRRTTEGRKFPWHSIRLPQTLLPISYKITLQTDLKLFKVKGNVTIRVNCAESTANIVLHLKEMNVSRTAVLEKIQERENRFPAALTERVKEREQSIERSEGRVKGREIRVIGTMRSKPLEMFLIEVNEKLIPQRNYDINMEFEYPLTDKLLGFYRSSYTMKDGEKRSVKEVYNNFIDL